MRHAAATVLVIASLISPPAAQLPDFGVGLLRPDGILVPMAVLDAGKWIDPWPPPSDDMRLDRMIESVPSYWRQRKQPVPEAWHLVTAEPPLHVNVLTHVVFGEHCGNQVGLLTDAPRSSWDTHRRRLALTRVVPVVSPVTLKPGDSEWRELVAHARLEVVRQEAAAIAHEEAETGRTSVLEPIDQRSDLTFRRLVGHRANGTRTLYFEAERRYKKRIFAQIGTEPSTLDASGWIQMRDGAAPVVLESRAVITDTDFKVGRRVTPLGILPIDDGTYWMVTEHGYESEAFTILHVTPGRITRAMTRFIGGC